ncbi:MAG: chemotaxis protein CheW [Candidatus Pacebacteria bacterium]|nr:chemotaxis protein CheW [Candidatus Paceibacterota bacterium]
MMIGRENTEVVEFLLGGQLFAIDLFDVKEVVECPKITKIPNSEPGVKGIIDLRGEITTIIDLKEKLRIVPNTGTENDLHVIILDEKNIGSRMGIVVDNVLSISDYDDSNIEKDISSSNKVEGNDIIIGIIKRVTRSKEEDHGKLIILIDIKKVLMSK